nr:hypothetical protein [Tanacetum cinerariifolium]
FETFYDHTEETRSDNTTTHATDSLPEYDSFHFKIEPDQEELFNVVMNDIFDDPSIPRPPPEPPDTETDAGEEIPVVMNDKDEDVYSSFIFVIFAKMFSLLSAKSEDIIFDPGLFPEIEAFLCWNFCSVSKIFISFH